MTPLNLVVLTVLAGLAGCTSVPVQTAGSAGADPAVPVIAADAPMGGSVARGAGLVRTRCAVCHAVGAIGTSPVAMAPPFRELSRRYPVSSLQEALAEGLVTAHPEMPVFAFEPQQVRDVIAYLESLEDTEHSVR